MEETRISLIQDLALYRRVNYARAMHIQMYLALLIQSISNTKNLVEGL